MTRDDMTAFTAAVQARLDRYSEPFGSDPQKFKLVVTLYLLADGTAVFEVLCTKPDAESPGLIRDVEPGSELEVNVALIVLEMRKHTFVEAEAIDAARLTSGHGGGAVRIENPSTIQLLIVDPQYWALEYADQIARGAYGMLLQAGVAAEQGKEEPTESVYGALFPPQPNLNPLPADAAPVEVRQLDTWPEHHRGRAADWAEVAFARLLRGDAVDEVRAGAVEGLGARPGEPRPWEVMPPHGVAWTYMYMMRRFGPPKLGYDHYKEAGCWYLNGGGDVTIWIRASLSFVGVGLLLPRVFSLAERDADPWWRPVPWIANRVVDILADLMRPTYVRDVYFSPRGRVPDGDMEQWREYDEEEDEVVRDATVEYFHEPEEEETDEEETGGAK